MKKHRLHSSAALAVLLPLVTAQAATYTFNATTTSAAPGNTWSAGTGWNSVPQSAADTTLAFGTSTSLAAGAAINTSQDVATPFLLNSLAINYAGPASGAQPNVTINTGGLRFVSNGATTPTISLNASANVRPSLIFNSAVTFDADTTISGASDLLFKEPTVVSGVTTNLGGVISNANNAVITKSGAGTLRIASDNPSYTGNFSVTAGVFQIGNNGSNGDAGTGTITLSGTGSLNVRRSGTLVINNTITGTGNVKFETRATATVTINKANTYVGTTTLSPTATTPAQTTGQNAPALNGTVRLGINNGLSTSSVLTITNAGTSVQTFNLNNFNQTLGGLATAAASGATGANSNAGSAANSKVVLGTGTLTVNDSLDRTFAGEISGAGNVIKQGSGAWTLGSANTFTGTTTISAGAITLGAAGSINASSLITVGGGATLNNNNASALTAPLALTEGATLGGTGAFAPSSLRVVADLGNGYSAITAGSSLTKAGNLIFDLGGLTGITTEVTYSLFSGTPSGSFTGVSVGATALGSIDSNATFTGTIGDFTYLFTNSLNQLTITPIPEPASAAALLGFGAIGVLLARRRRTT